MENSIKISSKFNGRSHHGAFRQHLKHRWKWWLLARSVVCLVLVGVGMYVALNYSGNGNKWADFISVAFILMGSIGFIRPMVWQMFAERKLRKHPAYDSIIDYEFTHDRMLMSGTAGEASVPWKEFAEVVATKKGLLIYQNKKDYLWIPAYDFKPHQMEEIKALFMNAKNLYRGVLSR